MSELKNLTIEQVPLLELGDKLILATELARSVRYLNHALIERDLIKAQLISGNKYTFVNRRPVYKPGEGTLLGWYTDVAEAKTQIDVPYEYFVIGQDLEGQLAARKQGP